MKKDIFKSAQNILLTIAGSVIYSAGMGLFLSPNRLAPGGVTGIAVIINGVTGFPTGITAFILNIPLLTIAVIVFGYRFFSTTVVATALSSLLIDQFAAFAPATDDLLLYAFAGGALNAVGIGLVFKGGASTGGTDIIVKLIRRKIPHIKTGRAFLLTDIMVIAASGVVSADLNLALYALIAMLVSSSIMDLVLYGPDEAKLVYIISEKSEVISQKLLGLDLGITLLEGRGAFSGSEKKTIMCAARKQLYPTIRSAVKGVDPKAFMIVSSANEVFGEGFKKYDTPEL